MCSCRARWDGKKFVKGQDPRFTALPAYNREVSMHMCLAVKYGHWECKTICDDSLKIASLGRTHLSGLRGTLEAPGGRHMARQDQ